MAFPVPLPLSPPHWNRVFINTAHFVLGESDTTEIFVMWPDFLQTESDIINKKSGHITNKIWLYLMEISVHWFRFQSDAIFQNLHECQKYDVISECVNSARQFIYRQILPRYKWLQSRYQSDTSQIIAPSRIGLWNCQNRKTIENHPVTIVLIHRESLIAQKKRG